MQRAFAALAAVACLALAAAGCGSDDSETSGAEAAPPTTSAPSAGAGTEDAPGARDGSGKGAPASGGSGERRGGEASIEDFGSEAEGSRRGAMLAAFHNYLNAVADRDFATACSYLAADTRRSLRDFAASGREGGGGRAPNCPEAMAGLLSPSAPSIAREQAGGEIAKVRVDGDRGFVIFRAPGAKLFQMTMAREAGGWKSTTVAAAILVPDL